MKPLLLLVIVLLAGCNGRMKTNVAKAVCDKVMADCCQTVSGIGQANQKECVSKKHVTGEDLFSVTMHEISEEMLTW